MLLFIDESGHDHAATPYEVLAGVAVSESDLWNLIEAIRAEEMRIFGVSLRQAGAEIKGVKTLKKKTFRLASEGDAIPEHERRDLARQLLLDGADASARGILVAYSLNWGTRLNRMTNPTRPEMEEFGAAAFNLRYVGRRPDSQTGEERAMYGVFYLDDLRPRNARD